MRWAGGSTTSLASLAMGGMDLRYNNNCMMHLLRNNSREEEPSVEPRRNKEHIDSDIKVILQKVMLPHTHTVRTLYIYTLTTFDPLSP